MSRSVSIGDSNSLSAATTRFVNAFQTLVGNEPFSWQTRLFHMFLAADIPDVCRIPTGLGKTAVVAVWLIAKLLKPESVPTRLVYVVNRRTVVDQTTVEVEKLRANLKNLPTDLRGEVTTLGVSTLRGQFADNREWSADPTAPAVIVGTVDMIGSRLLFGGYGIGFKSRPLHAGFLGHDALVVHDEAHLEPAFQRLLERIVAEQAAERRSPLFKGFGVDRDLQVMAMSATSRDARSPLTFTADEKTEPKDFDRASKSVEPPEHVVWRRFSAPKRLMPTTVADKELVKELVKRADALKDRQQPVLVFARRVEDVEAIAEQLAKIAPTAALTGTMRGKERDELVENPVFRQFLKDGPPERSLAYLVCTSAGEVGVDISASHMVSDLSTFDSMAQRFGRVNRYGYLEDSEIHVVRTDKHDPANDLDRRRESTWSLLSSLAGDASPWNLMRLQGEREQEMLAAFAPAPVVLPVSDFLFDAWSLTSIRGVLPGRPKLEPYLHGVSPWQPPTTRIAWREEVAVVQGDLLGKHSPEELLAEYPIKPHERLEDATTRVFDRVKRLTGNDGTPAWLMADDGSVRVTTVKAIVDAGKEELEGITLLLPPEVGGLEQGLFTGQSPKPARAADAESDGSSSAGESLDVADEWFAPKPSAAHDLIRKRLRVRVWSDDPDHDAKTDGMRQVIAIDTTPDTDDVFGEHRVWEWHESPTGGDGEGSKASPEPVAWQTHTDDVVSVADAIVTRAGLPSHLADAVRIAAENHDLGKRRRLWQREIGNDSYPKIVLAKSGGRFRARNLGLRYRHEFGSLVELHRTVGAESRTLQERVDNGAANDADRDEARDVALHLVATHHGFGRPHFPLEYSFDPEAHDVDTTALSEEVTRRFARLQRRFGRWGLAWLESLLRAADYHASRNPSRTLKEIEA